MRYLILLLAAASLASVLLVSAAAGQQGPGAADKRPEAKAPTPAQQKPPEDGVPRISTAEAYDLLEKGKAIIVDVRGEDSYRMGHVKGALWMPDVAQRTKELPRDKMIITYCS